LSFTEINIISLIGYVHDEKKREPFSRERLWTLGRENQTSVILETLTPVYRKIRASRKIRVPRRKGIFSKIPPFYLPISAFLVTVLLFLFLF
jgi:hypothetical protein